MKKFAWLVVACCSLTAQAQLSQKKIDNQLEAISTPDHFQLTSPSLQNQQTIPLQFICTQQKGNNAIPMLSWDDAPPGTQSFALTITDTDAPGGKFTHWLLYNIPATATSLSQMPSPSSTNAQRNSFLVGKNSYGNASYQGPCPPPGKVHHYTFTLYALKQMLPISPIQTANSFQFLIDQGALVIAQTSLTGTYQSH